MNAVNIPPVRLPIEDHKDEIIETVRRNNVVIVCGETGSGKTTQIPRYLLEAGFGYNKLVAVTQPRRIAAVSTARRVANEMRCILGAEVGFEVRFDKRCCQDTKIKFMTEGVLLNHCLSDRSLIEYGAIMIDEAHERNIETDVLLGLLKMISKKRDNLKIVIASATMQTEKFSKYFHDAPVVKFGGRTFPVREIYEPDYVMGYEKKSVCLVKKIHDWKVKGDILMFLTGQDDVEKCCHQLRGIENLVVLPLYGSMDYDTQQKIFSPVGSHQRKVVVATNIAETSITVNGIRFVIDSGLVKQNNFNAEMCMDQLQVVRVSKAQANQRKGRAGRTEDGLCYRLYNSAEYEAFDKETKPEIYRRSLSGVYLQLACLAIDPLDFDFIDKPNKRSLFDCKKQLQELELLDAAGNITRIGREIADFPVSPEIGKVLYSSKKFQCCLDVVTIVAMLMEQKSIFQRERQQAGQSDKCKKAFFDEDGDHFTLLDVYNKWKTNNKSKEWCAANFINYSAMERMYKVRSQLIEKLKQKEYPMNPSALNKPNIKRAFLQGFHKNVCDRVAPGKYINRLKKHALFSHPGSSLFQSNASLIMYHEVIQTKKAFMHGMMTVTESLVGEIGKREVIHEVKQTKKTGMHGMMMVTESLVGEIGKRDEQNIFHWFKVLLILFVLICVFFAILIK